MRDRIRRWGLRRRWPAVLLMVLLAVVGLCSAVWASPSPKDIQRVSGGEFVKRGSRWFYYDQEGEAAKDCLLSIQGKTYYFSEEGVRQYGWQKLDGAWYYFGKKTEGYMYKKAWVSVNGKRTYYLKGNGQRAQGWVHNRHSYYFDKKGRLVTGRKRISGVNCYFDERGRMTGSGPGLFVSSSCAILVEADTGRVLYSKNPDLRHANASTTKLMTAILALECSSLRDEVTASKNAASQEPTKLYLQEGETFYMKDLLYSLLIPSHNDTAVAIAEHIGGTVEAFAADMNERAAELGCKNTHFVTPNGLDAGLDHYTTVRDLARIACCAWKKPMIRRIVGTGRYTIKSFEGNRYSFGTTNRLLGDAPGVVGMKTGMTEKAGHCFVGTVIGKNGKTYISAVLGGESSSSRWEDSRQLLGYAYQLA
ncbi:MAG: serine hydrolase [Eubacteriales bacterium]|nr:serine hydrolase [Eubacteriales bacterium]